jgi:hypothetical protein
LSAHWVQKIIYNAVWYSGACGGDVDVPSGGIVAGCKRGVVGFRDDRTSLFSSISLLRSTFSYTFSLCYLGIRAPILDMFIPSSPRLRSCYTSFTDTLFPLVTLRQDSRSRRTSNASLQSQSPAPGNPFICSFCPICFHHVNSASFSALVPPLHPWKGRLAGYGQDKTRAGVSPYSSWTMHVG